MQIQLFLDQGIESGRYSANRPRDDKDLDSVAMFQLTLQAKSLTLKVDMTSNLEQRLPSNRPSSTANQRSSNQVNGFLFLDDIAHVPNLDNYFIRIFLLVRSAQLSTQLQGHKSQSISLSFLRIKFTRKVHFSHLSFYFSKKR